jgi:hypothetical protein
MDGSMLLNESWWKQVVVAFSWALLFTAFSLFLGGAGHGTGFFFVLAASPIFTFGPWVLLTAPVFWSLLAVLSQLNYPLWPRWLIGTLLFLHYAGVVAFFTYFFPGSLDREARLRLVSEPGWVILSLVAAGAYVLGQLMFYKSLLRSRRRAAQAL